MALLRKLITTSPTVKSSVGVDSHGRIASSSSSRKSRLFCLTVGKERKEGNRARA